LEEADFLPPRAAQTPNSSRQRLIPHSNKHLSS
jgi:hypothetical protein